MNQETIPTEVFDLLVLGSGEAGKYLAWTLARKGQKVGVVERRYVGGSCPNIACLPSKNVIHSAKVAALIRRSEEFGVARGDVRIDMAAIRERKRRMVSDLVDVHLANYRASGTELIRGAGRFIGTRLLEVTLSDGGRRRLTAENVVLSTGSRATIDDTPGLRDAQPLTHIEALELGETPGRLLILGGGYVGLEFAQALRRLGSEVTVIDRNERLLYREDGDVSDAVDGILRAEGIEVFTGTTCVRVDGRSGAQVTLRLRRDGVESTVSGTHLLVAAGRTPNTDGIGLESAGVETNPHGFVEVNARLETSAPGVWAVGDCAGSPQFTHIAFDDFRVVRDNLAGGHRVTTGRQVPFCLFTDPEVARVGLNETQAREKGIAHRVATLPMAAVLRTRTLSESQGFLKALLDPDTDRILGFTAVGVNAGELLPAVQLAMSADLPFTVLREAIFTHPTLAEGLIGLFANVPAATWRAANPAPAAADQR
ncbi:mercuric reductase [Opitutaceae bacterium EW11]|nr:mercuric reductase [Opitutaceae bacterium EW11]